jgi:predicted ATPase
MITSIHLHNFKCFRRLDLRTARFTLLAGLNGMGKSSVIQSLLLLRQSWFSFDLQNGRLALSGPLADLGTGIDILFEGADEDVISIGVSAEAADYSEIKSIFRFAYDRDADRLKCIEPGEDVILEFLEAFTHSVEWGGPFPIPVARGFYYLTAERFGPRKTAALSESHARELDLGARGEYALHILLEHGAHIVLDENDSRLRGPAGPVLQDQVDSWLQEISPGSHLTIEAFRRADAAVAGFAFDRAGDIKTRSFRATNVGFGLSYALPVILSLLLARSGALVMIENPEAHMHPRGQTRLGQLAARAAAAGVQVIVETHSDHFMDGVRIDVREGILKPEDAAFHYFERARDAVLATSPSIDADGRLDSWPDGFFDQHDENVVQLLAPKSRG